MTYGLLNIYLNDEMPNYNRLSIVNSPVSPLGRGLRGGFSIAIISTDQPFVLLTFGKQESSNFKQQTFNQPAHEIAPKIAEMDFHSPCCFNGCVFIGAKSINSRL